MEIITNSVQEQIKVPNYLKTVIDNRNFCFLDIETTGFNREKDKIILIGVMYFNNNEIKISQFFANSLEEEKEILNKFAEFIAQFDLFFTFNGNIFDIPFINSKFRQHKLEYFIDTNNSIDLLKIVRKHKNILGLNNCKLKTVEKYLGINRKDKISGKESIKMYFEYLKTKNESIKKIILKHNYEDIYYLHKLLNIYEIIDNLNNLNLTINLNNYNINFSFDLNNISIKENNLTLTGITSKCTLPNYIYYEDGFKLEWIAKEGNINISFIVNIGMLTDNKKCYYLNKDDYSFAITSIDETNYNIPENYILLKIEDKIIKKNLQNVVYEILTNVVK
ncbi:ribonuclease H-like domain-containing protein [Caloranaerobacter azorensis]|uniref:Ribonuclease H-like domain-containing protein n=1 Tax=Caloranaerobacter azorensis TaxID=116090 RepID=A0A6P1YCW0_9FIRM|nr:ribonuclease H-like domain-containing protein [Caloranaerobacter azorensis]QIB25876.1 ribonuclease H-like domain-containing protein [Caloranaerobacter azorensis]